MSHPVSLFDDYLQRLDDAAQVLPEGQREELLGQIREHLDVLRTELADSDEVGERQALERLGTPEEIVHEAIQASDSMAAGGATAAPGATRTGTPVFEMVAVALLLVGGFAVGIGWIVGVVMAWSSAHWTTREKLLGTLVWPGGLAAVFFLGTAVATGGESCSTGPMPSPGPDAASAPVPQCETTGFVPPHWVGTLILVAVVLAPFVVAGYLVRRAARSRRAVT